jgi:hypothetical protein
VATLVCHVADEARPAGSAVSRVYDVVDGQQRITTLVVILKCIEHPEGELKRDCVFAMKIQSMRDNKTSFRHGRVAVRSDVDHFLGESCNNASCIVAPHIGLSFAC